MRKKGNVGALVEDYEIRRALIAIGLLPMPATTTPNMIFTMKMPFSNIRNPGRHTWSP